MSIPKLDFDVGVPDGHTLESKEASKEAKVTSLFTKELTDFPGKEGLMITVEYPPGSADPIHHHNAHAFVYVLGG